MIITKIEIIIKQEIMKYLKMFLLIIVAMFTFGSTMAQVVVRARVGPPVHRHWHHRHWHRPHHRYYHH
jgi:hypothetical protein